MPRAAPGSNHGPCEHARATHCCYSPLLADAASNFSFANDVASTSSQNLAASAGLLETSFVRGRLREAAATALSIELSIEPSAAAK
ncbi:MAG: hypothetical protein EOO41_04330 [Methanobacteriota archaeon]|nr:MAG: hypothetical protein EOO41_04330 [Euryarchaeota archaeon]